MFKKCKICQVEFRTKPSHFKRRKYCSIKCTKIGLKGVHKTNSGSFKKGQIPWNKNRHPEYIQGKNNPMYGVHRFGKENPFWKGGRIKSADGYIYIHKPIHPFSTKAGYVAEHRLVMEKQLGQYLTPKEVVHHKGIKYPLGSVENKQDNRIENLMVFKSNGYHLNFHLRH